MKNSKKLKIVFIVLTIMLTILLGTTHTFAITQTIDPSEFEPSSTEIPKDVTDMAGIIVNILQVIGVVTSVIVIAIIGIKYMVGSVEQKADFKKTMIPYLVGVLMLVCTTTILKIIYNLVK